MKKPLVSVLICVYNAEKFIKETLLSVLNQSYRNIEVLILDNASIDKSIKIIEGLAHSKEPLLTASVKLGSSTRLIQSKKNIGPYEGLNLLLNEAKGEYIAINDHDDIWHPQKIEKQITFLEKNKRYVGCGTGIINWYEKYDIYIYRSQPTRANVAWHTSLVFRNQGYRYDLTKKVGTDFYFIKNILSQNKKRIFNFQEPYVLRRIFKGKQNLSGQWMKKISLMDIIKLKIGWFDKIALLNRYVLPQEWVERFVVWKYGSSVPRKYQNFVNELTG